MAQRYDFLLNIQIAMITFAENNEVNYKPLGRK
jgi:hypothetical protein